MIAQNSMFLYVDDRSCQYGDIQGVRAIESSHGSERQLNKALPGVTRRQQSLE